MKKINIQSILKIADEIKKLSPDELAIKDVLDTDVIDNRIAIIKLNDVEYEIWKTDKPDYFDVIKLVYTHSKVHEKDYHKRMSRQQVFKDVILKAFFTDDEIKNMKEIK